MDTTPTAHPSKPPHRAKKIREGEYEYRGYTITDHGAGRSVHAASMRYGGRWRIRKRTGPGYYDSEGTGLTARTLRDAKRQIDSRILRDEERARRGITQWHEGE